MVNVTAALILNAQEENRRKVAADKARVANLSKQLQMRLQYARLKVEHGWQRQSLNEVENLYFRHSTASKTVPKPKSTVRFTPSFQNITFSPPSSSAGPSQQGGNTFAPTKLTDPDDGMNSTPAASVPSATSVAKGSSTSIDPPTSQVPQRTPTLPDMPPPSVPSSTSISSYSDTSRVSSSHPTTTYTTPSPSNSMNSNAFAATSSSHAPQTSSSRNSASSSNQHGISSALSVGGGYGSGPQKAYPYPATSSNLSSSSHSNPPPLQQSSSQSHSQYPQQYYQQQNLHPSHSTSLNPAQLQNSQALAAYIAAQTQANYLASLKSSSSSSASASLSSTPQPYPYPQTQNQNQSLSNAQPAGSAQTLTHAHMSSPYLSPLVQQHPQYYPIQNQLHPQVLHQIQRLQAAQTHLRAQAAQLGNVPQPTPSTSYYRDPSQAPATGFHNHLVPTGQTAPAPAPNGFGGVHSHPQQQLRQHQTQQPLSAQTTSSETLQLGTGMPLKTFDIPTAPPPAPPSTDTETQTAQAGQMQMEVNPMQSNGSMTYDSFWSTHTMAGNWRKVVGQGLNGNLGGLSDAMAGGTTDASGIEASTMGDGMQVQSTGVPMSATDGLHG